MNKNIKDEISDFFKNKGKDIAKKVILDKISDIIDISYENISKFSAEDLFKKNSTPEITKFEITEPKQGEYQFIIEAPGILKQDLSVYTEKDILFAVGQTGNRKINFRYTILEDQVKEVKLENGILIIVMTLPRKTNNVQTFDIK